MGLGGYPAINLHKARELAGECRSVLAAGLDPIAARNEKRGAAAVEAAKAMTFADCASAYINAHEAGWRNPKHRQQWKNTLATYVGHGDITAHGFRSTFRDWAAERTTFAREVAEMALLKTGPASDRPTSHCLRRWWWGGDGDRDHSLYDRDGLTIARVVLEGDGHYHLQKPIAIPRQAWAHLEKAKRGAESFALVILNLPQLLRSRFPKASLRAWPILVAT